MSERSEDTKGVIRSARRSIKDRQYNDQKKIGQTMIYETLHSKLKIEQHEPYYAVRGLVFLNILNRRSRKKSLKIPKVGNQNPHIEEQTTQWSRRVP